MNIPSLYERDFEGTSWIKIKRFVFDEKKSWEENFKILYAHHVEETKFLVEKIRSLAKSLDQNCAD